MATVLSDHNCEGHAQLLLEALDREGFAALLGLELKLFRDVELAPDADDETVWAFCQLHGFLLLTGNRSARDGDASLEMVLRRRALDARLPILTIGDLDRVLHDAEYRWRCAERMVDIILNLDRYQGVPRLYLPG